MSIVKEFLLAKHILMRGNGIVRMRMCPITQFLPVIETEWTER
jgi:hypothetical protein